jgi:hypothetical protein
MVDVSTVKMLSKLWDPELKNGSPVKKYGHRALEDIRESIEELVYYKEHLWRIPASTSANGTNKVESNGDILVQDVNGLKLQE